MTFSISSSILKEFFFSDKEKNIDMEMPGIEPGASDMQSMRSTTELHPHLMAGEIILERFRPERLL